MNAEVRFIEVNRGRTDRYGVELREVPKQRLFTLTLSRIGEHTIRGVDCTLLTYGRSPSAAAIAISGRQISAARSFSPKASTSRSRSSDSYTSAIRAACVRAARYRRSRINAHVASQRSS